MASNYTNRILEIFSRHADPSMAPAMRKYMKNKFDFFGIKAPVRREISKPFLIKDQLPEIGEVPAVVLELWAQPQRELHYFSLDLLRKFSAKAPVEWLKLYESLILTKSWWDTVDALAAWQIGDLFLKYQEEISVCTKNWMQSGNIWLQRTCLLFQLNYKEQTDFRLLKAFISQLADSKEFFIRKAIGWSLRQYGKVDPNQVLRFLEEQPLSSLSYKEAIRSIMH